MKNINKKIKNKNTDAIAEARKGKRFQQYSKDATSRIRLAVEIYNTRNSMGLSQQALAKQIGSTQKTISRVENGDMNIGISLLNRFIEKLNFNSDTLARVFNCGILYHSIEIKANAKDERSEIQYKEAFTFTARTNK
jgi:transcriptional regulator with XRE-family HTH domain